MEHATAPPGVGGVSTAASNLVPATAATPSAQARRAAASSAEVVGESAAGTAGVGDRFPFHKVASCFEKMFRSDNRQRRYQLITELWAAFGRDDLFPLLRLVLPQLDAVRPLYKLKEKNLSRMYVTMLALPEGSTHAKELLQWKRPAGPVVSSFADKAFEVLQQRSRAAAELRQRLSVRDVNKLLDALAQAESMDAKQEVLREIHSSATALEQKWIVRIVLKDMGLGLQEVSILRLLHPDASEFFSAQSDLQAVCDKCKDPAYRLESIDVEVFKPLKPKCAARTEWAQVHRRLSRKGDYAAENKLDGERLLLHVERQADGSLRSEWWTRNVKNFTHWYGDVMAPVLAETISASTTTAIFDGEMMVWDTETETFSAFGENRSVGDHKVRLDKGKQPCYAVFDLLLLNGESLTTLPLAQRRERLAGAATWKQHSLELVRQQEIKSTNEVMEALDKAMEAGFEGVVFKSLTSTYALGSRTEDWLKLKPDYVEGMGDDLDLLILAGYYGEGRRRGGQISHFLVGVRAPPGAERRVGGCAHPLFYPICKVGTGYTMSRLQRLREQLTPAMHKWHKHARPEFLCGWVPTKTDDEPDVWFEPRRSIVMQVHAYEMNKSNAFLPCPYTLRFPRCARLRDDKSWDQAEPMSKIEALMAEHNGQIAASKRRARDIAKDAAAANGGTPSRSPRKRSRLSQAGGANLAPVAVPSYLRRAEGYADVGCTSDMLQNAVVVVRGRDPAVVHELELLVKQHGGAAHRNFTPKTTHIVDADDKPGWEVAQAVKRAKESTGVGYVIVTASWLLESAEQGVKLEIEPRFVRYLPPELRAQLQLRMDDWGDRYMALATMESMQQAMALVRSDIADVDPLLAELEVCEQLRSLDDVAASAFDTRHTILRGLRVYSPASRWRTHLMLRVLGAVIVEHIDAHATHAVLPLGTTSSEVGFIKQQFRAARMAEETGHTLDKWVVSEGWVEACRREGRRVREAPYVLLSEAGRAGEQEGSACLPAPQ